MDGWWCLCHQSFYMGRDNMLSKKKMKFITHLWTVQLSVLIPVLLAVIFITNRYINSIEQTEKKQLQYQVEDMSEYIFADFYEYVNKGVILFAIREFSSQNPFLEAESALRALNLLQAFSIFNDEQLCVYYGNDKIYYASGMESPDVYFDLTLNCTENSKQRGIRVLESEKKSINILNTRQGEGYLMYHIPVDKNVYGQLRSMQVYISFSNFANKMQSVLRRGEKLLIVSVGDENCYFYDDGKRIKQISFEKAEQLQGNSKWIQTQVSNQDLDYTVTALCDMDKQLSEFIKLRNISVWTLIIGIIFSAAVALVLSSVRFSRLSDFINNIVNHKAVKNKKKKYKNEYDYIIDIFNGLEGQRKTINDKNNILKQALLQHLSMKMFQGEIREWEEIQNVLKLCGVNLFEDFYYICGIKTDSQEQVKRLNELLSTDIRYIHKNECMLIFCEIPSLDYDMSRRKKVIEMLSLFLQDNGISVKQIIVSRVMHKVWPIDYGSLDVINILEGSNVKRKPVIFWEEWVLLKDKPMYELHEQDLKEFFEAIAFKNFNRAEIVIKNILRHSSVHDKEDKICKRFQIVQILETTLRVYDKQEQKQWLISEIAHINLLDEAEFERKVIKILQKYREEDEKEVLLSKILQLIEENCFKYDLSLEMLAEQTGVSKSWVSKMLKNRMGVNYSEYVTQLRMNKAKDLLADTDMSIGEVFAAVGYVENATARRQFKEYFKVTPSEYCQKLKQDKKIEGDQN